MRTGNPVLKEAVFEVNERAVTAMTLSGTVNKTALLLALSLITAMWTWGQFYAAQEPSAIMLPLMVGVFGGLIVGLVTSFKPAWAPVTAPLYALLEGCALGGISAMVELRYPGIVIQAVGLTFGTLFCLLAAYRSGLIRATENFKLGVVAATGAIALLYIVNMVMRFGFDTSIPFIHESGTMGILFSVFVVVIAALNLVLDFDFIETGVENGAPKHMEWFAAFGLMVTLVWLYFEILRLLSKLRE